MFSLELEPELQNLVKKIPIRYEDINKMEAEFPRSGMHNPTPIFFTCARSAKLSQIV